MHVASSLRTSGREASTDLAEAIAFSEPAAAPLGVWDAIESRRSERNYAKAPMSRSDLGSLLHTMTRPSAILSRHVVLWVIAHRVEGLASGVYRYDGAGHGLVAKRLGDLSSATESAVLSQQMAGNAAVVIVLGIRGSEVLKQGARAYRHAWLEAGMIGQRAYLDATGRGLAVCAAGAFFDDEASDLLGAERDEWPVHFVMVGRK
jgi:SagB-type dehydrogenase family enzyme